MPWALAVIDSEWPVCDEASEDIVLDLAYDVADRYQPNRFLG